MKPIKRIRETTIVYIEQIIKDYDRKQGHSLNTYEFSTRSIGDTLTEFDFTILVGMKLNYVTIDRDLTADMRRILSYELYVFKCNDVMSKIISDIIEMDNGKNIYNINYEISSQIGDEKQPSKITFTIAIDENDKDLIRPIPIS